MKERRSKTRKEREEGGRGEERGVKRTGKERPKGRGPKPSCQLHVAMGTSLSASRELPETVNFSSFLSTRAKKTVMTLFTAPSKSLN